MECLAQGGMGGEWMRELSWALPIQWELGSVARVTVYVLRRCGW